MDTTIACVSDQGKNKHCRANHITEETSRPPSVLGSTEWFGAKHRLQEHNLSPFPATTNGSRERTINCYPIQTHPVMDNVPKPNDSGKKDQRPWHLARNRHGWIDNSESILVFPSSLKSCFFWTVDENMYLFLVQIITVPTRKEVTFIWHTRALLFLRFR
jgi:hypothetical protein